MVRFHKSVGRPDLSFAIDSDDESIAGELQVQLSIDSLSTLVSDSMTPRLPNFGVQPALGDGEDRGSGSGSGRPPRRTRVKFQEDMAYVQSQGYSDNLHEAVVKVRPLGHGQFGRVWLAFHAPTQRLVALKEVSAETRSRRQRAVLEVAANSRHSSPFSRNLGRNESAQWRRDVEDGAVHTCSHVLKFFGSFVHPAGETVGLVVEYMNAGSLDQFVDECPEPGGCGLRCGRVLRRAAVGALRGLAHLHRFRVVHRDVKPANVLLGRGGDVKLGDLGDATVERDDEPNSPGTPTTLGTEGTLAFFSPERASGGRYGVGADVWALGVTLVAVWTGKLPYSAAGGLFEFAARVCDGAPPELPETAPSEARELVARLLTPDADARPRAQTLCDCDPFLKDYDWAGAFGDYWAAGLRRGPPDGHSELEAIATAVGFAAVRARQPAKSPPLPALPEAAPRAPSPKKKDEKGFVSVTFRAARKIVRRLRGKPTPSKVKRRPSPPRPGSPGSPPSPKSPKSPLRRTLDAGYRAVRDASRASAALRSRATSRKQQNEKMASAVGIHETLEAAARARRSAAAKNRSTGDQEALVERLSALSVSRLRKDPPPPLKVVESGREMSLDSPEPLLKPRDAGAAFRAAQPPATQPSSGSSCSDRSPRDPLEASNASARTPFSCPSLASIVSFRSFRSGMFDGSTSTTLGSVLDPDELNDTYALAEELGVDVFDVYEAMQRGEERAVESLEAEARRNQGDGSSDCTATPPPSLSLERLPSIQAGSTEEVDRL